MPAISFTDNDIQILADKHRLSLIGYFYRGRPSLEIIRKSFEIIGFKGAFQLGVLEKKHILIRFDSEEDYMRCWNRQSWIIQGHVMRVTKWTPDFRPNVESPVVPVWILLEGLSVHLHDKRALFDIAGLIGRPIKIDTATANLSRLGLDSGPGRVQVRPRPGRAGGSEMVDPGPARVTTGSDPGPGQAHYKFFFLFSSS
ncbi:unnamed protein product [Cuscuta europaea]|uniref:DUF4283 domain-containing protein n=1 Tax=Cuscuta europaea TaxID=41803 RepID=A0A9P0Z0V6_CUSEU|nr:unnamed protein product [Cuscuta europaea]